MIRRTGWLPGHLDPAKRQNWSGSGSGVTRSTRHAHSGPSIESARSKSDNRRYLRRPEPVGVRAAIQEDHGVTKSLIRVRTDEDLRACVDALAAVHACDRYPVDWPTDPRRWLAPADLVGAWVAVERTDVVGHVGLSLHDATELPPSVAEAIGTSAGRIGSITRLFITPSGRGHGLATRLLDVAREKAAELGAPLVLDVSDEGRAAIAVYERAGWERVASARADWLNTAGVPALLYYYVSPEAARGGRAPRNAPL